MASKNKKFKNLNNSRLRIKNNVNNFVSKKIKSDALADLVNVNVNLLLNAAFVVVLAIVFLFICDDNQNPTTSMIHNAANWTTKFSPLKPYGEYLLAHNYVLHSVVIFFTIPAAIYKSKSILYYIVAVFWSVVSNQQTDLMYYFTAWVIIVYSKLYKRNKNLSAMLTFFTILLYLFFFTNVVPPQTTTTSTTSSRFKV